MISFIKIYYVYNVVVLNILYAIYLSEQLCNNKSNKNVIQKAKLLRIYDKNRDCIPKY